MYGDVTLVLKLLDLRQSQNYYLKQLRHDPACGRVAERHCHQGATGGIWQFVLRQMAPSCVRSEWGL